MTSFVLVLNGISDLICHVLENDKKISNIKKFLLVAELM